MIIPSEDEEYKIRQQVDESNQNTFRDLSKYRLLNAFNQLNEKGQQTAADRVQELTQIEAYRKKED